jgi:signal transduction histidine kinase/DNA-binding NarL/FixJ family response regulator/HPt (histidine-containing phosphotransfer) domain-containing protein
MAFDLHSLLLGAAWSSALCVVVCCLIWHQHRDRMKGVGCWLGHFAFQFFGMVLLLASPYVPEWRLAVAGSVCMVGGLYLLHAGCDRFFGLQHANRAGSGVALFFVAAQVFFTTMEDQEQYRNIAVSLASAFFGLSMALSAYRARGQEKNHGVLVLFMGIMLAFAEFNALQGLADVLLPVIHFGPNAGRAAAVAQVLVFQLFSLAVLMNLMMLVNQRLVASLQRELQDKDQALAALHDAQLSLKESQRQTQDALRSRGEFVARMSHELLTPINAVLGMAYLGLNAQPSARVADYLQKIRQAGGHLMGVVNDVLNFSVIDSGKLHLEPSDFELIQVLNNAVQLAQERAHVRGLELHRELDRGLPRYVHGDALCIGRIIINFLDNAIKFTEQGHVILRVTNRGAVAGQTGMVRLRVEVSDTGVGLTPEQTGRLFTSFEQADTSNSRRYGGTGLGLVISKQLAELMGGAVGVDSEFGLGSTFWCELPLREITRLETSEEFAQPEHAVQTHRLTGLQVLVVDDSVFNLEVTRGMLEQAGAQVITATDGEQGLNFMRAVAFDCVLMDMQMPVMDGLTATRLIRQDPALASTLVIGLTANTYREHRLQCLEAGMNTVLSKAIEPAQLVSTIVEFLVRLERLSDSCAHPGVTEPPASGQLSPQEEWSPDELEKFVGSNANIQRRLLERYLSEAKRLCETLNTQQTACDWKGMGDSAHTLKSSSKAVGAQPLAQLCQALEEAGRQEDAVRCSPLHGEIQASFSRVKVLISAKLQGAAAQA